MNILSKFGVYKLECEQRNIVYVGQTQRNFEVTYKQNICALRGKYSKGSNFAIIIYTLY